MKSTEFHPADYDAATDVLRSPFLFRCVLLLQARARYSFVIAGSSRGQVILLLNFFIPTMIIFGWAVARRSGGSGILPQRAAKRSSRVALAARTPDPCSTGVAVLAAGDAAGRPGQRRRAGAAAGDIVALIWLLTNQRLRACFSL